MTEQQITEFDRWFDQFMDPELNLTPGEKELCRHAWQAALSHAEGEAVAKVIADKVGPTLDWCAPFGSERPAVGTLLYARPAPQVAVPEGGAQCEAHEPISTPHCPVCLLDERDELRGEVKRLLAEAEAAPQVAVPEPVGWVKWFGDEPSFQPHDALMPEDAKQHGWQLVGLMRSMNTPTAPAGELFAENGEFQPDAEAAMAAIGEQPVSDPDGLRAAAERPGALMEAARLLKIARSKMGADDDECESDEEATRWRRMAAVEQELCELVRHSTPAPDERGIAARPGYAGVTVWVGDREHPND